MNNICKGLTGGIFFIIGFLLAFSGIAKYDSLHAEESSLKNNMAFGKANSSIEVYVFTDWNCPGCRSLEPKIEAMAPAIMEQAKLSFIDDPVHPESMNYVPYNLSFMIYNKPQYFALRRGLTELSAETKTPTDAQVEAIAAKNGIQYKQMNYADVTLANKYFTELADRLKVEGTPTVVVVNRETKKGKKFEGASEINQAAILKAISTLSKKTEN